MFKMNEIKPCPFCGSNSLIIESNNSYFRINCGKCECHGPKEDTYEKAISAWNRRAEEEKAK